ncbi:hypothetical protein [Daejeonella oryzae]|uniref:hypothetical protein n=1 Tax=Daejeonella oryzae TaxID=1122943 RepID=UPI000426ABCA|nr:hypothetical protein [Daejeonella oryzae]
MKLNIPSILLLSIAFLSSCSSVYLPNVPDSPMLTEQGEFHAAGHISLKGNISVNSAYALSDNIGVIMSASTMDNNRVNKEFNHQMLEAGIGYFTTFGSQKDRIFEVYSGYGKGNSDRMIKDRTDEGVLFYDRQETKFKKYFVQVNYSSKDKKNLKLFGKAYPLNYGTVLRASYINMTEFIRSGVLQPTEDNIFLEPVFFTRMVINPNIQLQYTSGSNIGLKNRKYLTAGSSVFSFGVIVNLGGKN